MKKLFLELLVLVFLITPVYAQSKKADAPKRKGWGSPYSGTIFIPNVCMPNAIDNQIPLYGDVESLGYSKYAVKADSGVAVKDKILENHTYKFNKAGDVIEILKYIDSGKVSFTDYKYEYIGNMLDRIMTDRDQIRGRDTYRYNQRGNMIQRISYDSTGGVIDSFNATFDSNGNMIGYKTDNLETYSEYDEYGNIIERLDISKKSGRRNTYIYKNKYNAYGDLVEKMFQSKDGSVYPEIFKYDSAGNLIEYARYSWDGSLINCHLYMYDYLGNLIGYECDGTQIYFQYDSRGNIIHYTFNDKTTSYIVEFDIHYR